MRGLHHGSLLLLEPQVKRPAGPRGLVINVTNVGTTAMWPPLSRTSPRWLSGGPPRREVHRRRRRQSATCGYRYQGMNVRCQRRKRARAPSYPSTVHVEDTCFRSSSRLAEGARRCARGRGAADVLDALRVLVEDALAARDVPKRPRCVPRLH
jgi:hypothetical protein